MLTAAAATLQAKQEAIVCSAVAWRDVLARLVPNTAIDPSKHTFIHSRFSKAVDYPTDWTAGLTR